MPAAAQLHRERQHRRQGDGSSTSGGRGAVGAGVTGTGTAVTALGLSSRRTAAPAALVRPPARRPGEPAQRRRLRSLGRRPDGTGRRPASTPASCVLRDGSTGASRPDSICSRRLERPSLRRLERIGLRAGSARSRVQLAHPRQLLRSGGRGLRPLRSRRRAPAARMAGTAEPTCHRFWNGKQRREPATPTIRQRDTARPRVRGRAASRPSRDRCRDAPRFPRYRDPRSRSKRAQTAPRPATQPVPRRSAALAQRGRSTSASWGRKSQSNRLGLAIASSSLRLTSVSGTENAGFGCGPRAA